MTKTSTRAAAAVAGLALAGWLTLPVVSADAAGADDHGHHHGQHHAEPGDDHGHHAEPGDDHGHHHGDDHGRHHHGHHHGSGHR